MNIKTVSDFRAAIRQGAYAWPGGYPLYFITDDGAALSFKGAKENRRNILEAIACNHTRSGWRIVATQINWDESDLYCDAIGVRIESAYEEEEEE